MILDATDRFTARQAAIRSENAKRALLFLAEKSPQIKEALVDLAKQELARRKA